MKTMNTHTTAAGDVFLPPAIIKNRRRSQNRRRPTPPPEPLGIWLLIAVSSALAAITTYLLTQ